MERTNSIQWNPYISMFFIDAGRALYVFFMGTSYLFSMGVMLERVLKPGSCVQSANMVNS